MKRELYVKYRNERIVCRRLDRRIAKVMFGKPVLTREILFILPKPWAHLFLSPC